MNAAIDPKILAEVRRIQILTARKVTDLMAGQYQSVFKGRGMEFREVRHYVPGDDVRRIDWNVTARTGIPHVKELVEERELTVMLLVDASGSLGFGTRGRTKLELVARFGAAIALTAIRNSDKVGLIVFTDRVELFVPPRKGRRHVLRLILDLLAFRPAGRGTDIALALQHLRRITTRRTIAFLVSDFMAAGFETDLSIAARRHDLIAVRVTDPADVRLDRIPAILEAVDPETGARVAFDLASKRGREAYAALGARAMRDLPERLRARGVDLIEIDTDPSHDWVEPLARYFRERGRRL